MSVIKNEPVTEQPAGGLLPTGAVPAGTTGSPPRRTASPADRGSVGVERGGGVGNKEDLAKKTRQAVTPFRRMRPAVRTHPDFRVIVDEDKCTLCRFCVLQCSWDALGWDDRVVPFDENCVGCWRCVAVCPTYAIRIEQWPTMYRENHNWTRFIANSVRKQAGSGGKLLVGTGNDKPYPVYWDHLLIDACQVTNPSIDPLREPMELRTYVGAKPDRVDLAAYLSARERHFIPTDHRSVGDPDRSGDPSANGRPAFDRDLRRRLGIGPQLRLETPIMIAAMSYGAVSLNVQKSCARAVAEMGTYWCTGEGGMHPDHYPYADHTIVQVASGRFAVDADYLNRAAAVEIKIGQGAKPGIGGHLPGEKVTADIASTRMIPEGSDAISPAPHHDIYSIEDLRQLIFAIKEATRYEKPVFVKIAAVHNVAAIASGIVRAGADAVVIDGFRGGTGAAPTMIRDHVGIPIELALAAVDDRLRQEGIRNRATVIASGSIRSSMDVVKAIALGADAVYVGTAALIALGCTLCQQCHRGRCAWGLTTQRPDLVKRVDPEEGWQLIANLFKAWSGEIKETLGLLGINSLESLRGNRERLRAVGLSQAEMDILGVKPAGR